jgi:hypothetical protein
MMKIISLAFAIILSVNLSAQEMDIEGGIRTGVSNGITLRMLTGPDSYTEAMLLTRNHGVQFALFLGSTDKLYNVPVPGFSLSKGWGGHLGVTGIKMHTGEEYYYSRYRRVPVLGVDYYLGLNYTLNRIPLTFTIDYKPFAEILPERFLRINLWDFGFGIRYQFSTKI